MASPHQIIDIIITIYVHPTHGERGRHLDLLWFPVTQMWVSVYVCARLYLRDIPYSFSPMAFKFSEMVPMDKTLNW